MRSPCFEARAPGSKLDLDDAGILARIAPGVDTAGGRDGLVTRSELMLDAVDLDGELSFEHREALAIGEVVVRGDLPAGRDLEFGKRPCAAGLLARLQEGSGVALDRVIDPSRRASLALVVHIGDLAGEPRRGRAAVARSRRGT